MIAIINKIFYTKYEVIKMIINLDELNIKDKISINCKLVKDDDLDKRIIALKDTYCNGFIFKDALNNYILKVKVKGYMIINDAINLEKIPYPFTIDIEENVEGLQEKDEIKQNTLDLKRVLWQNIVLEVPISYTEVRDAKLKGNGWELINEEKSMDSIDPRLEKLKDLLKGDD